MSCARPKHVDRCYATATAYKKEVRIGDEGGNKCCEDCNADVTCRAYTMNYDLSRCYLFHAVPDGTLKRSDACDSSEKKG